ncbi:MAG: hypothetical protein HQK97_00405 [Nitrospirae bacterium]|nr:hypothetical protein [Nitrospirota bacterium]
MRRRPGGNRRLGSWRRANAQDGRSGKAVTGSVIEITGSAIEVSGGDE